MCRHKMMSQEMLVSSASKVGPKRAGKNLVQLPLTMRSLVWCPLEQEETNETVCGLCRLGKEWMHQAHAVCSIMIRWKGQEVPFHLDVCLCQWPVTEFTTAAYCQWGPVGLLKELVFQIPRNILNKPKCHQMWWRGMEDRWGAWE